MLLRHPMFVQLIPVIGHWVILNPVTGIRKLVFTLFEAQ